MRRNLLLLGVVFLFSFCVEAGAQSSQTPETDKSGFADDELNRPTAQRRFRPKLSLQDALPIAESYIDEQRIDISPF